MRAFLVAVVASVVAVGCGSSGSAFGNGGGAGGTGEATGTTGGGGTTDAGGTTGAGGGAHGAAGAGGAHGTTGAGGAHGGGGSQTTAACASLDQPCDQCMVAKCSDAYCGCAQSPDCISIVGCAEKCQKGSFDCVMSCYVGHGAGASVFALSVDCAGTTCQAACPTGQALDACTQCSAQKCAKELDACVGDAECNALLQCVFAYPKGDQGCAQNCGFEHLGAVSTAQDLQGCTNKECAGPCAQ
jgi:hypothetical protein